MLVVYVEIKIVTTETDPYSRYHGKTIDESLDSEFWVTQPDKVFKETEVGFTHTQMVDLAEGSHYVIYGNSASGYMWHTKIFVRGALIAEADVDRNNQLRGDFTVAETQPGMQTRFVNNVVAGAWANPANAFADDDACTSTNTNAAVNTYDFTNNPFTIPGGATITGLYGLIRFGGDGNDVFQIWLKDVLGVSHVYQGPAAPHGCADASLTTAGGDGELWDGTWTPAHINSADFQCWIRYLKSGKASTMYVDFVEITVYYTVPSDPYDTNVRLIGTVIPLYKAQVRNMGLVYRSFSAQVRNIGKVVFPYSSRVRNIGTVYRSYSSSVRNIGSVYRSFSAQVRNIGIIPLVVAKCHAELSVIRRRIF